MSPQVLITGVTGHVGSGVLIKALQEGYSVRAAVRSLSSRDKILNAPAIKHLGLGEKLTFVEVPDILAPGAYAEAIKDVQYVIHLASPIMHAHLAETNLAETVIAPAVHGTTNMLEAALASPTAQRVVVTSSVVANSMILDPAAPTATPSSREPVPSYSDLPSAYFASKHAALLASDAFMAEKKPHFDLINVMPGYVLGRKELATSAEEVLEGSNGYPFSLIFKGPAPYSVPGATIHEDDVALVHVDALKLPGKKNRDFGVTGDFDPNEVFGILQKHFPDAVAEGIFKKPTEKQQFHHFNWDASETEKVFKIKFKSLEEQVVTVAQQFLQLKGKVYN